MSTVFSRVSAVLGVMVVIAAMSDAPGEALRENIPSENLHPSVLVE